MQKTILITGATDGIGLLSAQKLVSQGHHVLLHGRNAAKLEEVVKSLSSMDGSGRVESYIADLSTFSDVKGLAAELIQQHDHIDVLINNAGVFATAETRTLDGLDVRFMVNTIAPYFLTQRLLPLLGASGRVINLSSAAQAPVDTRALMGEVALDDMGAYSQSKLAITMWSVSLGRAMIDKGPAIIAVNPGSLLASKMVKDAFGVAGNDMNIGADILIKAALSDAFLDASGQYFDNDAKQFTSPHPDGLDAQKSADVIQSIEAVLTRLG